MSRSKFSLILGMTKLSVNVNKFATLRNARGHNNPDVRQASIDCVRFGAEGITVHPRPDERHIRRSDVFEIAAAIDVEFNIEGYPSEDFLQLIETLVQEVYLKVERPALHVLVEVVEIRIIVNVLIMRLPFVVFGK